ncbi:hypothetical protein [Pseudonocardia sp. 73-21]|uniref:hypothetical protein n=1 Tax=Pseudonocardia sp. 73-21 TaxID=1895809 RepID=UPI00260D688A|nr:hypothetical protein [Pseudonocardia sp. 73-21]
MTDPVTDPRRADAHLHRAAEVLRRTARGAARGPWRWSDPDPEAGAAERLDRPTSMKDLAAFPGRPTAPPDPASIVVDRGVDLVGEAVAPHPSHPVAALRPAIAVPLAALLDALAQQMSAAIDAGGSLDEEPFRSALRLAAAIVDGDDGGGPGGGRP